MTEDVALKALNELHLAYLGALGRNDMTAWAACFADPGSYICTTRENEEQGLSLALMMDDSHGRILDRVKYVQQVWHGTYEDYRSRHVTQRTAWRLSPDGALFDEGNFIVSYTGEDGRSGLLATGTYHDEVVLSEEGPRYRAKKVVLDTTITPRYLVYPL